jgi:integrase
MTFDQNYIPDATDCPMEELLLMATIKLLQGRARVSGMRGGEQIRKTFSAERNGIGYEAVARALYEKLLFENSGVESVAPAAGITVETLATRYINEHLMHTRATGNRSYVDTIISRWGPMPAALVKIADVRPWIRSYLDGDVKRSDGRQYTASYCKKLVRYFQRVFSWGCEMEIVATNPLEHLVDHSMKKDFARRIRPRTQTVTVEQFEQIVAPAPIWFQRIARHAWGTGMREGEIAGLKWSSVQGDLIFLEADETKEADIKTIAMDPRVVDQVAAIRIEQEVEGLSEYVYLGADGKPLQAIQISDAWRRYKAKCGLTGLWFHDLRRSYVDRKRRAGVPKWVLSRQVGHHAVETTDTHYSGNVSVEELREAAKC